MRLRSSVIVSSTLAGALVFLSPTNAVLQEQTGAVTVAAVELSDLREWDGRVNRLLRSGQLRVYDRRDDSLIPGRHHERLQQYCKGIPVHGGDLTIQFDRGLARSIFGTLYAW